MTDESSVNYRLNLFVLINNLTKEQTSLLTLCTSITEHVLNRYFSLSQNKVGPSSHFTFGSGIVNSFMEQLESFLPILFPEIKQLFVTVP